jgi:hypothetical protein
VNARVNTTHSRPAPSQDWHAIVVLGLVMSVLAVLAAVALGGVIGESTVIVGVIVVASVAAWIVSGRTRRAL